jgi:uncharacterized protein (TIGR01777 family)
VSETKRVLITGASGFIGAALSAELLASGYEVVGLTRRRGEAAAGLPEGPDFVPWDGRTAEGWGRLVEGARAVVNLAGDSLAEGRWTQAKKDRILRSRTDAGRAVVEAVRAARSRPSVLVQASAVGFYGPSGDEALDESAPPGPGFLAGVAQEWEGSTREVESLGVRRAVVRTGLVLGKGGGVWPRLALPFRLFVGGPLGSGRQGFSWISLEDEARAIRFLIETEGLAGVFNLTAPGPLRQKDFCRVVARALGRPCWLPAPAPLLRLLFGEKARETLLSGSFVVPRRLEAAGFAFRHPDAGSAVTALLRSGPRAGSRAG